MIIATIARSGRTTTREYDDAEALFSGLLDEECKLGGADCVVRCSDDSAFFAFAKLRSKRQEEAQRAAQFIAGSQASCWGQVGMWPDGAGWRVLLSTAVIQAQVQRAPGPANGLRG